MHYLFSGCIHQGRQSWGSPPLPDFGLEDSGGSQVGSWGVVDGSWTGRGRVVKYYYILSCTGSMFESGDF